MHALVMCIDVYTCMHVLLARMFCWHACFAGMHVLLEATPWRYLTVHIPDHVVCPSVTQDPEPVLL